MKLPSRFYWFMLGLSAIAAAVSFGCSGSGGGHSLFGAPTAFPTIPKFLIAVDANGSGMNVNVFAINATTGALGAAVAGSPFDMGLTHGMTMAVHPNGHFVYVADANDGSIHAWDVNETTGVPTQIAAKVPNESGAFFIPSTDHDSPTHVITITPDGRFLYATNNDAKVSAYSIGSSGALTHIGDLDVGASSTGAITATNSFVWVTDTTMGVCPRGPGDLTPEHVHTMSIGTNGALTKVGTATLTNVFCWLWSIAVTPDGKVVQVGDEGGRAQVYSFTVGADGSLTQVGPQVVETSSSDCRDISFSPDGKFFYTSDDDDEVHAITQNANGSITELGASPYHAGADTGEGQIVVDLTGHFVYAGGETAGLIGYTRDLITGALTKIAVTPTAKSDPMAIGIVR